MAIIDVIKFEGPSDILVWKSPYEDFNIGSQLIVPESQEALFYKNGIVYDIFRGGRHTLTTDNIPLIRKGIELFTKNHKSFFTAQVYFVSKTVSEEMGWGTNAPIQLEDPKYGILINVKSFGSFRVKVEDSRKFLFKLVGAVSQFTKEEIQDYFRLMIMSKVKVHLARAIAKRKISILEITTEQDEIAKIVKQELEQEFLEYGVSLNKFVISSVRAKEEDLQKLKEIKEASVETVIGASARKQAMETLGTNYREMETLDIMKEAAKNQGDGGLTTLGVGLGLAPTMNQMFKENLNSSSNSKKCPKCGVVNKEDAKFCIECGNKFEQNLCPSCGKELISGAKFCTNCGYKITQENVCPKCNAKNDANNKFCLECGEALK